MDELLINQHATAYEVAGVLGARGYSPSVEMGGGGILEVYAPIRLHNLDNRYAIRFSSYADETICVIDTEDNDVEPIWYLPSVELHPMAPAWQHVTDFLNQLENETNGENN